MTRYCVLFLFFFSASLTYAQSLVFSGTVASDGKVQDDVLIDIYEYNSPIQTLHTDAKGHFSCALIKGKEYILVFYKSGLMLQSFSVTDNVQNAAPTYSLSVNMEKDERSPDGLYFHSPVKRIAPEITSKYFIDTKFDLKSIKPKHRGDSVSVLLNRAQANQYILVGNMKLNSTGGDTKYSRQIEENIRKEIMTCEARLKQNIHRYDSIYAEEDKHQKATLKTTDDKQLDEIIETQRLLAERLTETTDHYLLEQQQMLAKSRLDEMTALKQEQELATVTDSLQIQKLAAAVKRSRSSAVNDRYKAMDANRKFIMYNKYQMLNYQEYIELLRFRERKADTARTVAAPKPAPLATISPVDTSDNLSKMTDEQRTNAIQQALEEDERFKNYEEKTEVKNGLTVKDIRIAQDKYETQTDKKGNVKYFKNSKAITKITFEFETKRKMTDVLNTIKEIDKFGK